MNASTRYLCDLTRLQMGQLSLTQLRQNYRDGHYKGVPEQWLKEWKRLAR